MSKFNQTTITNEVTTGESLEKGGYFVAYNLVMRNAIPVFKLTAGEFNCLTMLFSYAGADKDKCFPSYDTLAENLDTDKRTVKRYIAGLEKKGVLIIYNRFTKDGAQKTNIYDLSLCLNKIRELFCQSDEKDNEGIIIVPKSNKNRDDKIDTPIKTGVTELSPGGCQDCHPTNNNIQITTKNIEEEEEITTVITENDVHNLMQSKIAEREITNKKTMAAIFDVAGKCKAIGTTEWESLENYVIKIVEDKMSKFGQKERAKQSRQKNQPTRKEIVPEWMRQQDEQEAQQVAKQQETQPIDLEEQRKQLAEEMKEYKKA